MRRRDLLGADELLMLRATARVHIPCDGRPLGRILAAAMATEASPEDDFDAARARDPRAPSASDSRVVARRARDRRPATHAAGPAGVSGAAPSGAMRHAAERRRGTGGLRQRLRRRSAADGDYEIQVCGDHVPPAPWANVIANAHGGFVVTERGGGFTWAENSYFFRLTPWHNDPASDPVTEAVYLRDEETGELWCATPGPVRVAAPYTVRHGTGVSFVRAPAARYRHGLTLGLAEDAAVKLAVLRVTNTGADARRLTLTAYVEWSLGVLREHTQHQVRTVFDRGQQVALAQNTFDPQFAAWTAFHAMTEPVTAHTGSRREFLGRNGTPTAPAALRAGATLSGATGAGIDPCAALQCALELQPGESREVVVAARRRPRRGGRAHAAGGVPRQRARRRGHGAHGGGLARAALGRHRAHARAHLRRDAQPVDAVPGARLPDVGPLGAVPEQRRLRLPRPAAGRDGAACTPSRPSPGRTSCARRRASSSKATCSTGGTRRAGAACAPDSPTTWPGCRTSWTTTSARPATPRCSTSTCRSSPCAPLEPDEHEVYDLPRGHGRARQRLRALPAGAPAGIAPPGPHGLPLIGTGDWNDGMNRVGIEGRGESVWLAWFLVATLRAFAAHAEARGDRAVAGEFRRHADAYAVAVETHGWDGAWYRRAYFDDGTPLGSIGSDECRIDSIAQSWSVISGAGDPMRQAQAMQSLEEHLVREDARLIMLLTPPFDETPNDPGYIKGYLPGVRENGAQYTHAALWAVLATALQGNGDRAFELYQMLNPLTHARTPEEVATYKVEPYVVAADVYTAEGQLGRGGWTWYTGSASWMYRVGLEGILGLRKQGDTLHVEPRAPAEWREYSIEYRHGRSRYVIVVHNEEGEARGPVSVTVDGVVAADGGIRLVDDGREHAVEVRQVGSTIFESS